MATINIKNLIKESITDYLNELNTEKEEVQEVTLEEGTSEFEDKVTKDGNIYLVKKPSKDTTEGGIVEEVSLKSLIGEGYVGVYTTGTAALAAGKKALKARDAKLKENIQIGKDKVTELETKIEELKRQIEDNSTRAVHDPQRRGELTETNDTLFAQLEKIENAVEKLKAALDKESPKKAKKEDKEEINEVTSNTPKAFKWFWGTDAKEIAKRIQALSDKDLKTLADTDWSKSGGPQKVQKQFLDREIKKRGLDKEEINENDPNAVYYLVKSASTGKYLVKMASKHASKSTTGTQRFKSESEAKKEADKRNKDNE